MTTVSQRYRQTDGRIQWRQMKFIFFWGGGGEGGEVLSGGKLT